MNETCIIFPKPKGNTLPKLKLIKREEIDLTNYGRIETNGPNRIYFDGDPPTLIFQIWRGEIKNSILEQLSCSTNKLVLESSPNVGKSNREDQNIYHFGFWKRYSNVPEDISDNKLSGSMRWIHSNFKVWQLVNKKAKELFPGFFFLFFFNTIRNTKIMC